MKRSEIIRKIQQSYEDQGQPCEYPRLDVIDFVLAEAEKLGMLPPETTREEPGLIRNEWTGEDYNG